MFATLSLRVRLLTSFAAVASLLGVVVVLGNLDLDAMKEQADRLSGPVLAGVQRTAEAQAAVLDLQRAVHRHAMGGADAGADSSAELARIDAGFRDAIGGLIRDAGDDGSRAVIARVEEGYSRLRRLSDTLIAAADDGDGALIASLMEGEHRTVRDALHADLNMLFARSTAIAAEARAQANATYDSAHRVLILVGIVGIALAIALGLLQTRSVLRQLGGDPNHVVDVVRRIAGGALDVSVRPEHSGDSLLRDVGEMQRQLAERTERERQVALENLRVREALDSSSVSIMVADATRQIVYANRAVLSLLRRQEGEIRRVLPDFRVDAVIGGSIDRFHRNPAHQISLLERLQSPHKAGIQVGDAHFALTVAPIRDAQGTLAGYVVEWLDRTGEIAVEQDIASVVARLAAGDVAARIDTHGKQDFFLRLAQGLNAALDSVEQGIDAVVGALGALARGDLTHHIDRDFGGKIGRMKDDANRTIEQIGAIVRRIGEAAHTIHDAATDISHGNDSLAGRSETQAASLEETASSMEELTAAVRGNAESTRSAERLAREATSSAQRGGKVVSDVVATMHRITDASKRIGDIISVIDGIAFQTNILALNAAVEAARAGDQGRGFAVVASEVRSLAQRSAEAAKEIKGLIETSTVAVDDGARLVEDAGAEIRSLVEVVGKVSDIMREITSATDEQRSGIEQVNETLNQLDEATQQNVTLVEQAGAAARALEEEATVLNQTVTQFRLHP